MFLLSRNKLVELVDRSSLFFKASCVENDSNFTYIRIVGEPLIIKITKIMNPNPVTGYDDEACQPKTCEEKNVVMTISNLNEELDVDFVYLRLILLRKII
jgi:hypothetical protein